MGVLGVADGDACGVAVDDFEATAGFGAAVGGLAPTAQRRAVAYALTDVHRIAGSRGARLPDRTADEGPDDCDPLGDAAASGV